MCKVSVVIPIYNVEKYVKDCVESVRNQTLKDIEIICVDDASTDGSLSIVRECAKLDKRIKVIAYEKNQSASQARKDGALSASGEYIMFLDGDDYLSENACENLYHVITRQQVDILHFGTDVINEGRVEPKRIENLLKILKPYEGRLEKDDVFKGCFVERKYRFSIWNKMYNAKLCKKAFMYVRDGNYPKAQDLYAFFILCYFAESYYGIAEEYYHYRFGAGITGNVILSLPQLERYCHSVDVAEAIEEFMIGQQAWEMEPIVNGIRRDLLNDCASNWFTAVVDKYAPAGFDILCKYWRTDELITNLCEKRYDDRRLLAEKVYGAEALTYPADREIKTIGVFYHRIALGGVQRVLSLLIPMYVRMGYQVVLFTDEKSEDEYELPKEVTRVLLPPIVGMKKTAYGPRAVQLQEKLREYKIDVLCYHAASAKMMLFDLLVAKCNHIPVVVTVHEVAFQKILTMNIELVNSPTIYKLADFVTVLSRVEEHYWRCHGVNAVYIPNPVQNEIIERDLSQVEKNTILWIGRLDMNTKRCLDIIPVMKRVVAVVPEARLLVVGNEYTKGIVARMEKAIADNQLEDHIKLCGYSVDVDSYYRRADLHMLTSVSESFSMTIAESKSYGMPLVMYDIPFLEICRDKKGFISVEQGNTTKMADAIIRVLSDEEYKKRLRKEAHESLRNFLKGDLEQEWRAVFERLTVPEREPVVVDEMDRILMQSLIQHYRYGCTVDNKKKQDMKKDLDKQKKIARSIDYRFGKKVLWLPRKVVRGLRKVKKVILKKTNHTSPVKEQETVQQILARKAQIEQNLTEIRAHVEDVAGRQVEEMGRPLVSVIIYNHNDLRGLKGLFLSLQNGASYGAAEYIVVDAASTDDSLRYLRGLEEKLPLHVIESTEMLYMAEAYNRGARKAKGAYLAFLASNTSVTRDWLTELLYAVTTTEHTGIVAAKAVYPLVPEKSVYKDRSYLVHSRGIAYKDALREMQYCIQPYYRQEALMDCAGDHTLEAMPCVAMTASIIAADTFWAVGGMDERYHNGYEDADLCMKLYQNGYQNYYCPNSIVYYHDFEPQVKSREKQVIVRRIGNMYVFKGKWQKYLARIILQEKLNNKHIFSEQKLQIAVATEDIHMDRSEWLKLPGMKEFLADIEWEVCFLTMDAEDSWYDIGIEVDVVMVLSSRYDKGKIRNCKYDVVVLDWENRGSGTLYEALDQFNKDVVNPDEIDICGAMPEDETGKSWGDLSYALAMKKELEEKGYKVNVRPRERWYDKSSARYIIVLRGLRPYYPGMETGRKYIMWNISHPEDVSIVEYNAFDHVFFASGKLQERIGPKLSTDSGVLLQCTDENAMRYTEQEKQYELLFVGNSRNVYRRILKDLLPTRHDLTVIGKGWDEFPVKDYVEAEYVDNSLLGQVYHNARILLNDHWDDMRQNGIISNRLYDALAAGTFVISDHIEEIAVVFEHTVVTYQSRDELAEKIAYYLEHEKERNELAKRGQKIVLQKHTFSKRMSELTAVMKRL